MTKLLMSSVLLASVALTAGCDDEPAEDPVGENGISVQEVARFEDEEVETFAARLSPF